MTANGKANQIAVKFYSKTPLDRTHSINAAIIVIDEIIDALKITTGHLTINRLLERQELQMDFDFWKDVKTELEAMK